MKLVRSVLVVACICSLFAAHAAADGLVRLASDDIYYVAQEGAEPSPSDVVPDPDEPVKGKEDGCGCEKATKGCGDPCYMDPWELVPRTCRGFKAGGWIQMGYHTEGANGIGVAAPALVRPAFNNYPNTFQMQQAWVYAEKAAETYGHGWDWGYRFDYVYGTDGQDAQSIGSAPGNWDTTWDAGVAYGHALPQLYAEVAYNDLSVKVGRFFTIAGYESVMAPQNFFYSHSATFLIEPFAHTGFVAEWDYSDSVTFYGGWTWGWDTGFERNGGDALLAGVSLQLTDALTFAYYTSMGDYAFAAQQGSDSDGYFHSILLDLSVTDRLTYVLQTDYLDNALYTTIFAAPVGPMISVNQYLFYELNDRWALGARFDWVRADGTQVEFINMTVGANWRPHPNVVIRPELRVDDFDVPGLQDSTTFGIDAIFTF